MMSTTAGWIECVAGGMFAGKSAELIRRLQRATYAKRKVVAFKPSLDDRYHATHIASHDGVQLPAFAVKSSAEIEALVGDATVVGIDEAQFFDVGLVEVCRALATNGKRVIVAGLDLDYRGVPFGPMPHLLAVAEQVTKVHACCTVCGELAPRSQRIVDSQEQVVVGGASAYEARCIRHWSPEPVFTRKERAALGEFDG